ncbi:hypothetical protein JCGZ_13638 [Jatropha curcas]|uniref:Uncharacterized protein n=1 Tax=Jatropha curcas TaxID=180498 RepID=A0A067KA92_JATCU|nr:hypothetical protein JCGZ_13638 [Jatropha curcas]
MIAIGGLVIALVTGLTEFDITDPPYPPIEVLPVPEDGNPLQSLGGGGENDLEDPETAVDGDLSTAPTTPSYVCQSTSNILPSIDQPPPYTT